MPTVAEIQAQQAALKVMEAENALPHLNAAIAALQDEGVTALASLCVAAVPQIADPNVLKALNAIGNILSLSPSILARLRDEALRVAPVE